MAFHLNLQTETVANECLSTPLAIEAHVSVRETITQMQDARRGSACICRDGILVGIFTERDALKLIATKAELDIPVESVMAANPTTVLATDTVQSAIEKMAAGGYRRLPVLDENGQLLGIVKVTEILHYLVQHFPEFVYNLPPNPDHASSREGA